MYECKNCGKPCGDREICFTRGEMGRNTHPCYITHKRKTDRANFNAEAGIPKKFNNTTFETYTHIDVVDYVRSSFKNNPSTYFFSGSTGLGKTHLAIATLYELSWDVVGFVKFRSFSGIMGKIYEALNTDNSLLCN